MIILINTSGKICLVTLIEGDGRHDYEWQSDMQLSRRLLGYLDELLKRHGKTWDDIDGIGAYRGPGSFTGIRIGLTVMNTIADGAQIPIVGGVGENWQEDVIEKLNRKKDDKVVLPFYDRGANITIPRK
jgi:tRNA threonylcarbamoyladenosine biosynthesis protein TsaB